MKSWRNCATCAHLDAESMCHDPIWGDVILYGPSPIPNPFKYVCGSWEPKESSK